MEDEPELLAGVTVLAGEPRFRQLYVDLDRPERVAQRWQDRLGPNAWVRTRDDAIDDGWFGRSPTTCGSATGTCWWPCGTTARS